MYCHGSYVHYFKHFYNISGWITSSLAIHNKESIISYRRSPRRDCSLAILGDPRSSGGSLTVELQALRGAHHQHCQHTPHRYSRRTNSSKLNTR